MRSSRDSGLSPSNTCFEQLDATVAEDAVEMPNDGVASFVEHELTEDVELVGHRVDEVDQVLLALVDAVHLLEDITRGVPGEVGERLCDHVTGEEFVELVRVGDPTGSNSPRNVSRFP